MINIKHITPRKELAEYVRKISIFESENAFKYKHKLTPSAFTYLSYNHEDIPLSIFGNKKVCPKGRIQIAGPKINEKIYVEYNGKLSQILIEFTASGFYYLFHHSPSLLINKLTKLNKFILPDVHQNLENYLRNQKNIEQQVRILENS